MLCIGFESFLLTRCFDVSSGENSLMAVSLSTNAIKLYSPATGQYLGDCLGHTNTISDISFPDLSSPNILCSSSADGTVRAWDIRSRKEVCMKLLVSFFCEHFCKRNDSGSGYVNRRWPHYVLTIKSFGALILEALLRTSLLLVAMLR